MRGVDETAVPTKKTPDCQPCRQVSHPQRGMSELRFEPMILTDVATGALTSTPASTPDTTAQRIHMTTKQNYFCF